MLFRELDVEMDVHVAEVVVTGRGHALAADHLDSVCEMSVSGRHYKTATTRTLCNGLAGQDVDAEPPVVKVLDEDGSTSQGRHQLDLALVKKVVLLSRKSRVRLLFNLEDDITGLDTGSLVALAAELDLGAAANAFVDVDVQDLPVDDGLLAVALLAAILLLDDLALAVAVRADGLEALNHGPHLAHHRLHAMAVTAGTPLDGTLLAADAFALRADDGALQSQLRDLAAVDVLQRNLVGVMNGPRLGGSAVVHAAEHTAHASKATTAEKLREQVLGSHATAARTSLEAGLAILVVQLSLLGIREDLVRVGNLFELLFGTGVVRVLVYDGS